MIDIITPSDTQTRVEHASRKLGEETMTTVNETEAIVIADNDPNAFRAARESEKNVAIELAKSICVEHGIEERVAVNNSMFLERTILEQRQVGYKKGRTLAARINEWIYKCSLCK